MNFKASSVARDIGASRRRAQALIDGVSADQLTRRPDPGKWSIAECLAHLNITAATVQKLMARGIEQAKQEKRFGEGPFSIGQRPIDGLDCRAAAKVQDSCTKERSPASGD